MEIYSNPIIISLIIGIIQAIKIAGMPKKFAPLVSLALGISMCVFFEPKGDIKQSILNGIISGLTASGLFSGYHSMTKNSKK
ncbi:hypothetical protein [Tepidibacter formicigenes]|jgi:hypothetical protein|uniref:Phage holin family Hol44, holin superfamily V n=1 Tax=Tepidibacter formicigenes DSM 15518 TaxID=1123349 RepID=A0A1M6LY00_9FIRM|nr:hypothetical protein [Tepidibacter formicigenes]SHJ76066.1 hypothetical protein SAMN02744037_00775 [Tepidibacter formicigenes DSM 15518]